MRRALWLCAVVWVCAGWIAGCRLTSKQDEARLPSRHSVRGEQLLVYSDFRIAPDHELIQDLKRLRTQVYRHLELPEQMRPVVVYLFDDETSYREYLQAVYPGLPHRRAYFFKTPRELAVFTYWGDRIQEDLRHEFTHGLLHASLKSVPLWLDEGLAEYFEVVGPQPGELNGNYANELLDQIGRGWTPSLDRLEALEEFSTMQRPDYREAWAWVHFMLHQSPETRETLLGYLQDLRTQDAPFPLSKRLKSVNPDIDDRFLVYVAALNTFGGSYEPGTVGLDPVGNRMTAGVGGIGIATVGGQSDAVGTVPEYHVEVPSHVQSRVLLAGDDGHVSFGDGPTVYAAAHRHGWDDLLRAVRSGRLDLADTEAVERFAEDPGSEYWKLAREARRQGILDCVRALRAGGARTSDQKQAASDWPDG